MNRILIVDDEPAIGWSLRELLADDGHVVDLAATVDGALTACAKAAPAVILLDVRLPGRDGISAIPDLRAAAPAALIIVMTAFGDLDTAVRAVEAGAFDHLVKPFDLGQVVAVVTRALAERPLERGESTDADEDGGSAAAIVGSAAAMQEVFKRIALIAGTDMPVLLTGGPGTGKKLAARAIHDHGPRRDRPFLVTNLAALAPTACGRELFGHAAEGPGLFELAAGGTILLADVDAAPPDVQATLVQVLESGEVVRTNTASPRPISARVIAATAHEPAPLPHSFRPDLAARLGAFTISLPPLAARRDDIEPLARAFLVRHSARRRSPPPPMTVDFLAALAARDWPDNVRGLRHAVEHAAVVSRGGSLRPEHLPQPAPAAGRPTAGLETADAAVGGAMKSWAAAARAAYAPLAEPDLHHRALKLVEATLLREVLAHTGGNRTAAAKLLGLDRATLRSKFRSLGIED